MVKGRNEPALICQVLEVLAGIRDEQIDEIASVIHATTKKMFFGGE